MNWPFRVLPHEDELLSSYLVRTAHSHGLSPYRFCAFHFGGSPVWNRDIDRSAPDALLKSIADKAQLDLVTVTAMTLRDIAVAVSSATRSENGIAPWLNSVGVFHRKRRRWGLQYCPTCLAQRPSFRRPWRLSLTTICDVHGGKLLDACPHCDAPVVPHRQSLSPQLCHSCNRSLTSLPESPATADGAMDSVVAFQSQLLNAIESGRGAVGQVATSSVDYFNGLHALVRIFDSWREAPTPVQESIACTASRRAPSLEWARTTQRVTAMRLLHTLTLSWPASFDEHARKARLSQRSFVSVRTPEWLGDAIKNLPAGTSRPRTTTPNPLRAQLRSLHRCRRSDWRTQRAILLLAAAEQRQWA